METTLREVVARALWQDEFRLREWRTAKEWQKKAAYRRADEALRRAGLERDLCVVSGGKK